MRLAFKIILGACLLMAAPSAEASPAPKNIALAKLALVNIHIERIWKYMNDKGIDAAAESGEISAARAAKVKKSVNTSFTKAVPGLIDKVAATVAPKYSLDQLANIERLSEVPAYQAQIANLAINAAAPDMSKVSPEDKSLMAELADQDYVNGFVVDAIQSKAMDATVKRLIKQAFAAK